MGGLKRRSSLRLLFRLPVSLYHLHLGRLLGHRFLLLTHTGRHTGLPRQTVLEVMEYREEIPEAIVMSGFGRNSDWLRNIEATPNPQITIASQNFPATFRFLSEDEAVAVVKNYERRNWLAAGMVRAVLSRLLGWKYSGSDEDRHKLVRQLPVLGFRPR